MKLFHNLRGNASEMDMTNLRGELEPVLAPGEKIGRGFKIFRDMFVFTDHRLIMIDKQGVTGSKVSYHSILYRSITQFYVETAGSFDADAELKIWVSGSAMPITKQLSRGSDVVGLQKFLAYCAFGGVIEKAQSAVNNSPSEPPTAKR
jgi:PH (Pleckstrin Homology) domain-containing protein